MKSTKDIVENHSGRFRKGDLEGIFDDFSQAAKPPEFSPYLEGGIVNNLWSGSEKSRQREIAVLRHGRER